ncbi:hypothetical protein GCM10009563_21960 [Subtercola frigoramans]
MRIHVGGAAVRRPAGVPDARRTVLQRVGRKIVDQHRELARTLSRDQVTVIGDDRHTGGVIAPIFQTPKAAEENLQALGSTDIAHDSTHGFDFTGGYLC